MGTLWFVCPTTGREVSTGLDMDSTSYHSLPNGFSQIKCPDCNQIHNYSALHARLGLAAEEIQQQGTVVKKSR